MKEMYTSHIVAITVGINSSSITNEHWLFHTYFYHSHDIRLGCPTGRKMEFKSNK